jgi:hypothetical protein
MPPYNPIQTNFTAGEVSKRIYGRVDLDRYPNGLKRNRNFINLPQGPIRRRSGTYFSNSVKDQSAFTKLLEFEFNKTQAYIIESGDTYFRFYKNNSRILEAAKTITAASNATPIVVTSNAHGFSNGDFVVVAGVLGNTAANNTGANGTWVVANITANTFELTGSVGNGAYTSGGTASKVVQVTTPYTTANIPLLSYIQSADTMYLTHGSYAPRKLTRSSHTSWSLTAIDFQDGPYLDENTTATTLTFGAATGTGVTVTASAITGINGGTGFQTTDVGRLIRFKDGATLGWAKIVGWTSTTVVTVDIKKDVTTSAKITWRLGAWSDTTGWPTCATFHQNRLCFGGSTSQPQTFWMSESGLYESFAPTDGAGAVQDDSGITYTIASNKVNSIYWMESGPVMLIGTASQEWQAKAGGVTQPITPTNIDVTPQTSYGSKQLRSRKVDSSILFIQRGGRKIRELVYDFQQDGYKAKDISILSDHMLRQGGYAVDVAYQQESDGVLWCLRNDGKIAALSYQPDESVRGWSLHTLGGVFSSGDAVVESIAVIPTSDGTADQLWMVVKRTINSGTKRYIEYMDIPFEADSAVDATNKTLMYFMDSGLSYSGAPATTFSNLHHLEGQTVQILGDGAVFPSQVVTSGAVTISIACSEVRIGLGYRSLMENLPLEGGAAFGTAQGKIKRTGKIGIRVIDTLGMKYGISDSAADLKIYPFRNMGDNMDSSPPLRSGDILIELDDTYKTDGTFVIVQDDPLPMTIEALMPETVVYK